MYNQTFSGGRISALPLQCVQKNVENLVSQRVFFHRLYYSLPSAHRDRQPAIAASVVPSTAQGGGSYSNGGMFVSVSSQLSAAAVANVSGACRDAVKIANIYLLSFVCIENPSKNSGRPSDMCLLYFQE